MKIKPPLFVLVRSDLTPGQQLAQSGHTIAQWMLDNPKSDWKNSTLIILGVKSKNLLQLCEERLKFNQIKYSVNREPDMYDEATGIAASDLKLYHLFKNLPLALN